MNRKSRRCRDLGVLWIAPIALVASGCTSPLASRDADQPPLSGIVDAAIERELRQFDEEEGADALQRTRSAPSAVEEELAGRRDELDALTPSMGDPDPEDLGPDLLDRTQEEVRIDRVTAQRTAVANGLSIRRATLQPAISQAALTDAQAAFDAVFFTNARLDKIDEAATVPVLSGIALGTPFSASESYRFETGVRKLNNYGGTATLSTDLTRSQNNGALQLSPDPAYAAAIRLGYAQPLLRGFGRDVNTAAIRLAANAEESSIEGLRSELLSLLEDVDFAYWNLVVAWHDLDIGEWLLAEGERIRKKLEGRRGLDALQSEYADAVARVEQRKGEVLRARRNIRAASDALKALLDDPELSVGSEIVLRPTDTFARTPIDWNLRESMLRAVAWRPEIRQALLASDDASIRELVAENGLLPIFNIEGHVAWTGLDDNTGDAYSNTTDRDFINYMVRLVYEVPIGNRGPDAQYLQARLRRADSLLAYREAVKGVIIDVKSALRDVVTNYELVDQTRAFRVAQAENWRTTLVEEETRGRLTPEFLNLEFQRQETLATARRQELIAMADYERSLAALWAAMGTGLERSGIEVELLEPGDDGRDLVRGSDDGADR